MSQKETIKNIQRPRTVSSLKNDILKLGVKPGMKLIVHSSLSSIGWVSGGAHAVVEAITDSVTESGIVIMPTHSSSLSEPSYWQNPPVPEKWWHEIRDTMPAFDSDSTLSEYMGKIPEVFRHTSGVKRSYHPSNSFAVFGNESDCYIKSQSLNFSMSDQSPLGELYKDDGHILLIGVGHESNTSLHLAESRILNFPIETQGGPIKDSEGRRWVTYQDFKYDSDDFEKIGFEFESKFQFNKSLIGSAESRLIKARPLIDFAENWISINRKFPN